MGIYGNNYGNNFAISAGQAVEERDRLSLKMNRTSGNIQSNAKEDVLII